ncbi:MAG: diguanylate cyclase, partial [Chloroflexota bacterium]|nr:diguanylate cyclase [Chloroflexota bacterium]
KRVVATILAALEEPFVIEGAALRAGASIGVVFAPQDGEELDVLMRRADAAMYQAKRSGGSRAITSLELPAAGA